MIHLRLITCLLATMLVSVVARDTHAQDRSGIVIVGCGRTAADPAVPGSAGWGDALSAMMRPGVSVSSHANPGRTLKQFLKGDGLNKALARRPAWLLIGFGQTDAEAATTITEFSGDLTWMIETAKKSGVAPVLVTPPVLRTLDPVNGKRAIGVAAAVDAHAYADAIRSVASVTGSQLLDLQREMQKTYREIGDRSNWFIHPPLDISREPASNVRIKKTWRRPMPRHPGYFSQTGAESLAHWLTNLLRKAKSPMSKLLRAEDGPPTSDYKLVWQDEFDGSDWDRESWRCRYPGPRKDGINDPKCIRTDNGHLVIDVKKVGDAYHAGMLATGRRRQWTHGYFECRMTLATQPGYWNAFWLMADSVDAPQKDPSRAHQTRRNGTEIDVVEYLAKQGDVMHMNLHWNGYGDLHRSSPSDAFIPGLRERKWHVFGVEWTTNGYTFYVDGRRAWSSRDAPSDVPQHIVLSVEVGKWAGDISKAPLPQQVRFDWVRVWQKPRR